MRGIAGAILQQKIQASSLVPSVVTEIYLEEILYELPNIPTNIDGVYIGVPNTVTGIVLEEII